MRGEILEGVKVGWLLYIVYVQLKRTRCFPVSEVLFPETLAKIEIGHQRDQSKANMSAPEPHQDLEVAGFDIRKLVNCSAV